MTHRPGLKLRLYLVEHKLTYKAFAEKLKTLEEGAVEVAPVTVQKWAIAGHIPRKPARDAINQATNGQVPPASFL